MSIPTPIVSECVNQDIFFDNGPSEPLDVSTAFQSLSSDIFHHIFSFTSLDDKEILVQVNKFWTKTVVDQTKLEFRSSLHSLVNYLTTQMSPKWLNKRELNRFSFNRAFETCKSFWDLKHQMRCWNKIIISKLGALQWVDICKLNNKLPGVISLPFCDNLMEDAEIESLKQESAAYCAPYNNKIFSPWKESYFDISFVTGRLKMMLHLNKNSLEFYLRESQLLPIFLHVTKQFDKLLIASKSLPPFEKQTVENFVYEQRSQLDHVPFSDGIIDQLSCRMQKIVETLEEDELKEILMNDVRTQIEIARKNLSSNT